MENLISVIIPMYNIKDYIEECLDSVINQTYKNLQIVLVDDGSNDGTEKICDLYAQKDKRREVIHKKNNGVSSARNTALEHVKGEYIVFVDSDDFIAENEIEVLLRECKENNADMAIAGVHDIRNGELSNKSIPIKTVLDNEEGLKEFFKEKYFICVVWNKMYKKSLIDKERFDETLRIAEDFEFLYRIMKKAKKVALNTTEIVYFYRIRTGSLMREKYNEKFENEILLSETVLKDVQKIYPNIAKYAIRRYQRSIISCIDKYFRENGNIEKVRYLLEKLNEYPLEVTLFHKTKLFLLLYARNLLMVVYKFFKRV